MSLLFQKESYSSQPRSQPPPGLTSFNHLQGRHIANVFRKEEVHNFSRRSASMQKSAIRVLSELEAATREMSGNIRPSFASYNSEPEPSMKPVEDEYSTSDRDQGLEDQKFAPDAVEPPKLMGSQPFPKDDDFTNPNPSQTITHPITTSNKSTDPPRILEGPQLSLVAVKSSKARCCVIC